MGFLRPIQYWSSVNGETATGMRFQTRSADFPVGPATTTKRTPESSPCPAGWKARETADKNVCGTVVWGALLMFGPARWPFAPALWRRWGLQWPEKLSAPLQLSPVFDVMDKRPCRHLFEKNAKSL
jgi:hypothetical protein